LPTFDLAILFLHFQSVLLEATSILHLLDESGKKKSKRSARY